MCLTLLYKLYRYLATLHQFKNSSSSILHEFTHIRIDAYTNSFYPKTIREWNDLPQQIVDATELIGFIWGTIEHLL